MYPPALARVRSTIVLDGPAPGKRAMDQPPLGSTPSKKRQREEQLEAQRLRGETMAREPAAAPAAAPATASGAAPGAAPGALAEARAAIRSGREEIRVAQEALKTKERELEAQGCELAQVREEAAAEARRARQERQELLEQIAAAAAAARAKLEPKLDLESSGGQAGSSCGSAGHGAASAAVAAAAAAAADEEFTLRLLALRQYIEMQRLPGLAGKAAEHKWKWTLHRTAAGRRQDLCDDVLCLMQGAKKKDVFRPTVVSFVNTDGLTEDGVDSGGLTAEAHSAFWREVCLPDRGLFSDGLPAPGAPPEELVCVGRMLAKSLCDDHVTGGGLACYALEYLVHGPTGRALLSPHLALEALSECDAELAQRWRSYLDAGNVPNGAGLQLSNFDEGVEEREDNPVTSSNLTAAVLAGCRHRLLTKRQASLDALRQGFTQCIDLSVQLAPLSSAQLALMVRGRVSFSPSELVECFRWPEAAEAEEAALKLEEEEKAARELEEARVCGGGGSGKTTTNKKGRAEAEAARVEARDRARDKARAFVRASDLLRAVLSDAEAINEGQRLALLQWATGLNALPKGGLKDQAAGLIKLLPYPEAGDATLPEVHTCTRDMHLPSYVSSLQVADRLLLALAHSDGGFNKE